jgi:DNA-directed RNA polymerase subunit K/omega
MTDRKLSRSTQLNNDLCVEKSGGNRFDLVLIASARSRELSSRNRQEGQLEYRNSNLTALLEIQEGKIGKEYLKKVK